MTDAPRRLLVLLLALAALHGGEAAPGDACDPARRLAWAHYVAWHHPSDTAHLAARFYDLPAVPATGDRPADLRAEIAAARAAGLDGFFVDVVGRPRPAATTWTHGLAALLDAARGTPFLVGACLDGSHADLDWQVEELERLVAAHAGHPNYPRIAGRSVFATYHADGRSPEQWLAVRDGLRRRGREVYLIGDLGRGFQVASAAEVAAYARAFDMLYLFSSYPHRPGPGEPALSTPAVLARLGGAAAAAGRPWMPCLWPGYLGAWLNGRNDYHQPFRGVDVLWEGALALDPGRDAWVHLTTWNDHDETTLMPTAIGGEGRLALAAAALARWRGEPAPARARLLAAYRREELVGTRLRIEVAVLPGRSPGRLAVSGRLRGGDGAVLAELPERVLAADAWERAEWLLPTHGFAASPAWTPELTVREADGAELRRTLPAILPAQGWLQNPVTMVVPLDRVAAGTARLALAEVAPGRLRARLAVAAEEPVRRAELWRNDRRIAGFAAPGGGDLLHLRLWAAAPRTLALTVAGGRLLAVQRRGGPPAGRWDAAGLRLRLDPVGVVASLAADGDLRLGAGDAELPLADLLAGAELDLGEGMRAALSAADPRPDPGAAAGAGEPLEAGLLTRALRPGDRFCARVELASGRVLWSPVLAPAAAPARRQAVLATARSLDSQSGASGSLGQCGWLAAEPEPEPALAMAEVHAAARRASRWRLAAGGADLLGDRPLALPEALLRARGGPDDGPWLALGGRDAVPLPRRLWPLGAGTIALRLRPDPVAPAAAEVVLARQGWASGPSLALGADRRLVARRDGGGLIPADLVADRPLPAGAWTAVRLVLREDGMSLWLDGVLAGRCTYDPGRSHGNATAVLGDRERGFRGGVADLAVLGWDEEPAAPDASPR